MIFYYIIFSLYYQNIRENIKTWLKVASLFISLMVGPLNLKFLFVSWNHTNVGTVMKLQETLVIELDM